MHTKAILFLVVAAAFAETGCRSEQDEPEMRNGDANVFQVESQHQKGQIKEKFDDNKQTVLRVNIPDHANRGKDLITLGGREIAFAEFVPRFRTLVESRQFSLIEVYWGKVGSEELEQIVNGIADSANVTIEKWVFSSTGVELWPRDGWSPKLSR